MPDNMRLPKGQTRRGSPAASLSRFGWILWLVLLAALGVRVVTFALGDLLRQTNPSLAVLFDSGQSTARAVIAERVLQEDEALVQDAVSGAQNALRSNPLSARAMTVLGNVAEDKNDEAQAARLFERANRSSLRDLTPQLWLLQREIQAGNVSAAIDRLDVIFRGHEPGTLQPLISALSPMIVDARFRPGFAKLLQAETPWRKMVLREVSRGAKDIPGLNALFTALQAGSSPPDGDELKEYLNRLLQEGWVDQAYLVWSKSLPPDRLERLDYLYNARFQYPLTNLPFDWLMPSIQGALVGITTESARRVLNVDFFGGRVRFANVSHLLTLGPGAYKFSGQERAQNLNNERGLRWRIYCLEDPSGSIVASSPLSGDQTWREFSFDFKVPDENCRYQNLLLELPAQVVLETEISGGVSYANLKIQKTDMSEAEKSP
ncbi:hypothetical protein PY365_10905 [Roseiarcaceae bacterium H3SJ34-1]|uniref:tetratricopeptide repeat protein n=1 Tax=Terripilifer ovatus TaxID=3032367 RepID=UPI003AB9AD59|nr:hypothetical protein [Roseiarcaceae bacterium H3SJ34-1]